MEFRSSDKVKKQLLVLVSTVGFLATPGCKEQTDRSRREISYEIDREFAKGPLTVHVKVERARLSIAETFRVRLEANIDLGYRLTMPALADFVKENEFGILDYRSEPDRLTADNHLLMQLEYRLEPFLSGSYFVPALKFIFSEDTASPGADQTDASSEKPQHELITEPIAVQITSLEGVDRANLEIRDIKGVVSLPKKARSGWIWLIIVLAGLLVSVAGIWYWRRRRRSLPAPVYRSAHEIAFAHLETLQKQDLISAGHVKEFYEQLSHILRRYIEDRFALRAPERTTEEFLQEAGLAESLSTEHRPALKRFLEHCDLVKFACYDPQHAEIDTSLGLARKFIEATKSEQKQVLVDADDLRTRRSA